MGLHRRNTFFIHVFSILVLDIATKCEHLPAANNEVVMENLLSAPLLEFFFTAAAGASVLSAAALTLCALPWTDQSIRHVDKSLNPLDLTQEGIPLPTLSRA